MGLRLKDHPNLLVPNHFPKLESEIWIFPINFIILNNYEQHPILLLWFYDYCIDISISNLKKQNLSWNFFVRNEPCFMSTGDIITTLSLDKCFHNVSVTFLYQVWTLFLKIFPLQNGVDIHGVLGWAPWVRGCTQGHVCPYMGMGFTQGHVLMKCFWCIFETFQLTQNYVF